jgi:Sec-independent protein secretion pathway component TatC
MMAKKLEEYKRYIFIAIIIIALGITLTTTAKNTVGAIGTVFIAIGGLLFIIGMNKKRKQVNTTLK